ncbi:MAG: NUDIX hydrolase [Candidatus Hydrogenedentes bacterium]|nr:NUDIX hydrolase [Candidatus Hydrogenedentota bacterium]
MARKGRYTYDYPRPMVTVDAVVFAVFESQLRVATIRRRFDPYAGAWALPGGFVEMDEDLDAAAARELAEEAGIRGVPLVQFRAFGAPGRDPRGRSISVAFLAAVDAARHPLRAADDAAEADWLPVGERQVLAFDHAEIVEYALDRLRELVERGAGAAGALLHEVPFEALARAVSAG